MKIVGCSTNPEKNNAVTKAFEKVYPDHGYTFVPLSTDSGVGDQPMNEDDTKKGALGRIQHAKQLDPNADLYIGLEGGVADHHGELFNHGWVVIETKEGKRGFGRPVTFALPPEVARLIKEEGLEQSDATNKVLSILNTKHGSGTIGPMTRDLITYTDWYIDAVICALIPFINSELYK